MDKPTPHIYYYTHPTTKGTHHLTQHLPHPTHHIQEGKYPTTPYILITPTYAGHPDKGGYLPSQVRHWLNNPQAQQNLVGVIGTGDINWGKYFCAAADEIATKHNVPVLHRVDRWGNQTDIDTITNGINQHWETLCRMRKQTNAN